MTMIFCIYFENLNFGSKNKKNMNKQLLYQDNNVSEHVLANMNYDRHLKIMKGTYCANPYVRNKFS